MNITKKRSTFADRLRQLSPLQRGVYISLAVIVIVSMLFLALLKKEFYTITNLRSLLIQVSSSSIMAFGISFVLITGGIDISISSVLSFSSVMGAYVMQQTGSMLLGFLVIFGTAIICGSINGLSVARFKMPAFVVTLAMMIVAEAIGTIISNSRTIVVPNAFRFIAKGEFLGIPMPVIILLVVGIAAHITLTRTIYGRWVFAVGVNPNATGICSIPTRFTVFSTYVISSIFAAIGGIILTARLGSASLATTGDTTTLDTLCAAIVGGVSLSGGKGSIPGVFGGALFVLLFQNLINLFGIDYYLGMLIRCVVILLATFVNSLLNRERG